MPVPIAAAAFLLVGLVLGVIFFGGLWLTVRALPTVRYPTALAVASFWGRTAAIVGALAFVFTRGWENALICLTGFVLARLLLSRFIPQGSGGERAVE